MRIRGVCRALKSVLFRAKENLKQALSKYSRESS